MDRRNVERSTSTCTLEQEDAEHWIYRGEGAVNLVLAYIGSSPSFVGKVLRIQKVPRESLECVKDIALLSVHECLLWKDANDLTSSRTREIAEQLFVENVMTPLLGSQHVDLGIHIRVSRVFLESIENKVRLQRPAWRVEAAEVNVLCGSAILMSDHSVVPRGKLQGEHCICVELKPKCGFLPSSRFLADGNTIKSSVTRFRMHQFLKFDQKEILEISEYDPLDLFSQSKERIQKAIRALFDTPQNNLRVFLDGSQIFGGLGGSADTSYSGSAEAFERALTPIIDAEVGQLTSKFIELVAETVFRSQVLDLLLEVQKLDMFDIEGAIHAYYDVVSRSCLVCKDMGSEQPSDIYDALHSIPLDESLKIVRNYLIAATAKDCSLMITLRPREDGNGGSPRSYVYLESTNQSFDYKANFIDLDMKPLKKMEHYYELDQRIVRHYTQKAKAAHN